MKSASKYHCGYIASLSSGLLTDFLLHEKKKKVFLGSSPLGVCFIWQM